MQCGCGGLLCSPLTHTPSTFFSGGTLTAQRYRHEILELYLRPYRDQIGHNLIFMDDNARPHRARLVNEYLQSENIRRMDWPARSPDLNPIEHVWDALGRRIGALHPSPRTLVELRTALLEEWGLLPLDLLQSLGKQAWQTRYYRLTDLIDTHPGLVFLKEAAEFHSRYVHTVIARIFYCVNRFLERKISLPELRNSNFLKVRTTMPYLASRGL
ncbi:hypothetical protein LAZ67_2005644 [Cordylochernes scorpioides]|uniref:Tc1-like transposase DDE domain-containing protein n=1 Tax=Cordylochernes scorpioides TaxID=51811 RepID=A0ABY6K7X2_9ARAC|nr:hypothetical protein LAZ67_2005644 [Cordylochernes scorpioides]